MMVLFLYVISWILEECIMVTTVQSTFRQEALATLEEANNVNHAVLISYSRRVDDLDPLAFSKAAKQIFRRAVFLV